MVDRASTFNDPIIVNALKESFVCVAVDAWYMNRRQDAEGEFYRKVVSQDPGRRDFTKSTQGKYALTPGGKLIGFTNHGSEGIERVRALIKSAQSVPITDSAALLPGKTHPYFNRSTEDKVVVDVTAKILVIPALELNARRKIFMASTGRDHLWILKSEASELIQGRIPEALKRRLARFHLNDFSRGEPTMWTLEDIKTFELTLQDGKITGHIKLEAESGARSYEANLLGFVESKNGELTRFDLVAKGLFLGKGHNVESGLPGKFPVGISFRLADPKAEDSKVPPQGSRDLEDYLK